MSVYYSPIRVHIDMFSSWTEYDLNILDEWLLPLPPSLIIWVFIICSSVLLKSIWFLIIGKLKGNESLQSAQYTWWILLSLTWQDRDGDDNLGDDQPSNDDSHAADLPDTWHPANQRASWCRTDQSEAGVTLRRVSAISPHVSCHNIVTQRKSTRLDHCSFEDRFLVILINDVLSCFNEFGIYF